jgi:predicted AlkP superfamily pyrophosphatase or phosphodiesterase
VPLTAGVARPAGGRSRMTRRLALLIAALAVMAALAGPGAQTRDPLLVLVSFDGWRWDYIDRANVPNLKALAARGVRAKELIPSFPSLTFPNHYTLVTGLYPGHHGIVANTMATPAMPQRFSMSSSAVRDAAWWGGEPLWVTAIRQNRRAMTVFWPGSEAPIGGVSPTRWWPFDANQPNAERVRRVLDWLSLPEEDRPAFVSLYFEEVDHVGHVNGPDSPEALEAAAHLDLALGQLVTGIERLGLADRTTIVVVSDHGMARHADDQMIVLDAAIDPATLDVISTGEFVQLAPPKGRERDASSIDAIFRAVRGRLPHVTFYKRDDVPARYHYRDHPHIAPIIGVVDEGWILTTREHEARRKPDAEAERGAHGYDPALRSMHGLFIAAGPAVRAGLLAEPFENIHVYEFLCAILKLTPAPNDGDARVTRGFLR